MAFSLYAATVPSYLQILDAVPGLIGKAEAFCAEKFIGRDMRFAFGDRHLDYTAENFLLSFSQPNFYFHAATTYDILRWKGVPLGKRDFVGKSRIKR